jgi:hypothetical protein
MKHQQDSRPLSAGPREEPEFQRINYALEVLTRMEQAGFRPETPERNVLVMASHVRIGLELLKAAYKHHQAGRHLSGDTCACSARDNLELFSSGGSGRSQAERGSLKILQDAIGLMLKARKLLPGSAADNLAKNMLDFIPSLEKAAVRAIEAGTELGY